MALATKAEEWQCCQEIDRCGEVIEPADNTEGVKKNFLDIIFSTNSGPSNLYGNEPFSLFIRAETSKS